MEGSKQASKGKRNFGKAKALIDYLIQETGYDIYTSTS